MILFTAPPRVQPLAGPALPLKMCQGLPMRAEVQWNLWTNGAYGVVFSYKSPLSVKQLGEQYLRERPDAKKANFTHDSYNFYRYQGSVCQVCWITKNVGSPPQKFTTIQLTEIPIPLKPAPQAWYGKAIAPRPPAPLIQVPFDPAVTAQSVFPFTSDGPKSRPRREGSIFNAYIAESFPEESRKAAGWLQANGYQTLRPNVWFKPHTPIFEVELTQDAFEGSPKNTCVTMYFSTTQNDQPRPYDPPHAGKA